MINEARTLLLNMSYENVDTTLPYSEYVPEEYVELSLPTWLTSVRSVLFGMSPTQAQLDIRLRQYMQLLHAGLYADHITSLDQRITYLPFDIHLPDKSQIDVNIGDVLAQLEQVVHTDYPIFRTPAEPYATCRNLWTKHQLGLYRLTGVLLTVIYCTRDLRNGAAING